MAQHTITNDEHWHQLRARNIGGSEVAALFGLSPWQTHYTLYHEKAGLFPVNTAELNQKTHWGKLIEPLIAQELGRTLNWRLEASKTYFEHDTLKGAGCTLDFEIYDHEWGPGICETKVVFDYSDFARDWSNERAPAHIELQAQHQMFVTGKAWCAIQVWIAQTATLAPALIRRPNEKVTLELVERLQAFWQSIDDKKAPSPTGTEAELEIMRTIWPQRQPKKIVELADPALTEACSLYVWSAEQMPGLEREKTSRKAQLLNAAQDAEKLIVPDYEVNIKQDKRGYVRLDIRKVENDLAPLVNSTLNAG